MIKRVGLSSDFLGWMDKVAENRWEGKGKGGIAVAR